MVYKNLNNMARITDLQKKILALQGAIIDAKMIVDSAGLVPGYGYVLTHEKYEDLESILMKPLKGEE